MSWNKEDRSFKILINKRVTDSGKAYYEEVGSDTLDLHLSELKVVDIYITDNDPSGERSALVSSGDVTYFNKLVLTEDTSVAGQRAYYAEQGGNRITDWIGPKYNAPSEPPTGGYFVELFDNNDNQIFPTNSIDWFWDYQTGILTINGNTSSFAKPFKLSGYAYTGTKGIVAISNVEATTAGTVLTYTDGSTGTLPIGRSIADIDLSGGNFELNFTDSTSEILYPLNERVKNIVASTSGNSIGYDVTYADDTVNFMTTPRLVREIVSSTSGSSTILYSDGSSEPISLGGGGGIIDIENSTSGNGQNLIFGDGTPTKNIVIESWAGLPFSSSAPGVEGYKTYDGNYFYVATGTNEWKRTKLDPFIAGDDYVVEPPESSSTEGEEGQISFDSDYLYLAVSKDNWKRIGLENFNDVPSGSTYSDGVLWQPRPANYLSQGVKGQKAFDETFLYICVEDNLWKRARLDLFTDAEPTSGVVNDNWVERPEDSFDSSSPTGGIPYSVGDKAFDENYYYIRVTGTVWKRVAFDFFGDNSGGGSGTVILDSQVYTSDGIDINFLTNSSISLINYVTINGIVQRDVIDYTVTSSNTVTFTTAPANNSSIIISYFTGNGVITTGGSGSTTSDRRVKDNIKPLTDNLNKVDRLQGVSFTRTDLVDKKQTHIGFIAQDVLDIVPEVVVYDSVTDRYSLKYQELNAVLVEAIKELNSKVEKLTSKVEFMENDIEKRLSDIEKKLNNNG